MSRLVLRGQDSPSGKEKISAIGQEANTSPRPRPMPAGRGKEQLWTQEVGGTWGWLEGVLAPGRLGFRGRTC